MTEPRPRRRGAVLDQAILRAAAAELVESGYPGVTMDRVARRAGTNKNAIYRRWPSRAALCVAAFRQLVSDETRIPDTGELRGDILALLCQINRDLATPRSKALHELMAALAGEPELMAQIRAQFTDRGANVFLPLLGRAVARGEITPEALHPRVATVGITLLRNEYLINGFTPVPEEVIVEIVDEVYLPLLRSRGHNN